MMMVVVALLVSTLVGFLLVRAAWPGGLRWERADWLRLPLGFWIGTGLTSIPAFLWRDRSPVQADLVLLGIAVVAFAVFGREPASSEPRAGDEAPLWQPGVWMTAAVCAAAALGCWFSLAANPHGDFDAWRLWNIRPLFLYRGETLQTLADPLLAWAHPEVPYLLSASVLRLWQWAGSDTMLAPSALAGCFTLTVPMAVYGFLLLARTRMQAYLGLAAMAASGTYLAAGVSQVADLPLSALVFGGFAIAALADVLPARAAVLAGLCAGLAAWAKFEGGFHGVVLVGLALWRFRGLAGIGAVAGALPGAAMAAYFLTSMAPKVPTISANPAPLLLTVFGRMLDFTYMGWAVTPFVVFAVYVYFLGRAGDWRKVWLPVVALFAAGCIGVMVRDDNSGDSAAIRVILHVWPVAVASLFLFTKAPEEVAVVAVAAKGRKTGKS